jgi:alpha-tubulin suppressor-like RCC1 family protein
MKTILSKTNGRFVCRVLNSATILVGLISAQTLCAAPRSPLPPVPEHQPIFHESFDEDFFEGQTNAQLAVPGFGFLDESWSGYALDRTGETVVPFIVPALDSTDHKNLASDTGGALRCWINPSWSSQSLANGTGPGTNAVILELDAVSGGESAVAWSLQASADGNTLNLIAQTTAGIQTVLQSPISWQAGQSHCLALDFNQNATALYVDGILTTQGSGLPSIPVSVGQLAIGSAYSGSDPAGGSIEEFYSFDAFLSDFDVAAYEQFTAATAALGPVSDAEQVSGPHKRTTMESIYTPGNVYDPQNATPCSPGGPFYITNLVSTLQPNGTATVTLDIYGGTNGVFYDIFSTPNLNYSLKNYQWNWIGQGLTCNSYTFTNQPPGQAFYTLELSGQTFTVAFDGYNSYGQLNTPSGLSNAVAIAAGGYFSLAMLNNGTVIGWGDNSWGELDIPSGLTNVIGIAGGYLHGVALLANGSVTNWGYYYDGGSYVTSVSDTTYASQPPTSGVMAIAAGMGQDLALMSNGTVVAWGFTNIYGTGAAFGTQVPGSLNLTNVAAIACGWQFNLALSSNGTVTAWGYNNPFFGYPTNVPSDLTTNVAAIAAGGYDSVAVRKDGTVEAWGDDSNGVTNTPAGLSNVVAVATGGQDGLALLGNGNVVAWGLSALTNIPQGMAGVKAIAAGFDHNLVLESGILTPIIFTQPQNQYAPAGSNVTFSAEGEGVAGVTYQWQFNGVNIAGATSATLTLTNVGATNNGNYDVVVSTSAFSLTSATATFTLVIAPVITAVTPTNNATIWFNYNPTLNVSAYAADPYDYPIAYTWHLNGTNLNDSSPSFSTNFLSPPLEGAFTVGITNIVGGTSATWNIRAALPGMSEAWGDNGVGECSRPVTMTNVIAIAAGEYDSVVVTDTNSVVQWGDYWDGANYYSVSNTSVATQPPPSNFVAVAAGIDHNVGLTSTGTVLTWGLSSSDANYVPTWLPPATAIGCGWEFNVALLTNSKVVAWGDNIFGQTNVPTGLSNVVAIAAGAQHGLALSNGIVIAWGYDGAGQTDVPSGLNDVVAIAAGDEHSLALRANGTVVAWGDNAYGQTNVPVGLSNVMAIAAGGGHSVALKNDGTLVEWGDNSSGQTTVPNELPNVVSVGSGGSPPSFETLTYPPIVVKLIAAGGDHTMAAIFSPWIQYPVNVSKDLLLIYNATNISYSSNVCAYYMTNRPGVANASLLGLACPTTEGVTWNDYTNTFVAPIVQWLSNNPTLRPQYVILFQDLPSRVTNALGGTMSIQFDMNSGFNPLIETNDYLPQWKPFVTAINMNGLAGTNDCIHYINKLTNIGTLYASSQPLLIPNPSTYPNNNWYFDDNTTSPAYTNSPLALYAFDGVLSNGVSTSSVDYQSFTSPIVITTATNVAGYFGWGCNGSFAPDSNWVTDTSIVFSGSSDWFLMTTTESFNGQRVSQFSQSTFLTWYASNAFAGTNYSNTPAGAACYVDEPYLVPNGHVNSAIYFGDWADGRNFAISAWAAAATSIDVPFGEAASEVQFVGDPFLIK